MNANLLVVDANVLVKLLVEEEFTPQARALFRSHDLLIAPDIAVTEATNAFVQKVRRGEMSDADARRATVRLPGVIDLRPASDLLSTALNIALEFQRSAYDALYVALALSEGCKLVTGDRRVINALRHRFGDSLTWIGALPIV